MCQLTEAVSDLWRLFLVDGGRIWLVEASIGWRKSYLAGVGYIWQHRRRRGAQGNAEECRVAQAAPRERRVAQSSRSWGRLLDKFWWGAVPSKGVLVAEGSHEMHQLDWRLEVSGLSGARQDSPFSCPLPHAIHHTFHHIFHHTFHRDSASGRARLLSSTLPPTPFPSSFMYLAPVALSLR